MKLEKVLATEIPGAVVLRPSLAGALGTIASMEPPLAIVIVARLVAQGPLVLPAMPAFYRLIGRARSGAHNEATA